MAAGLVVGLLGISSVASPALRAAAEPEKRIFEVFAGGKEIPTVRFGDIEYVQFHCAEKTPLTVRRLDGVPIESCRVRPERLGIPAARDGASATLPVAPGQKLVVNVDRLQKLFVFAERPDSDGTDPESAAVDAVAAGADPAGRADSTAAIQVAIDSLPAGGVLHFPPGIYRSGSLRLKSDMTLHLDAGATLKGSDDHHRFQTFRGTSYLYYLLADGLKNVRITGRGTIDGNGSIVRRKWEAEKGIRKQPGRLLLCVDSEGVEVRGVILRDSYSWITHFAGCRDSRLRDVKILADTRLSNGDGLDVDGCRGLVAENLFIYAEDDAISVKAAWSRESPRDLTFRDCVLWSQNATGIRLGTETRAETFRQLVFEDLAILRANTMIRIFCEDGADIHDVVFRNIDTEELTKFAPPGYEEFRRIEPLAGGVTYLLQLQVKKQGDSPWGRIRDVLFENINARAAAGSKVKGYDAPEGSILIRDITIRGLRIGGQWIDDPAAGRFDINEHAEGVRFEPAATPEPPSGR